ncbi:MAG TPA: hypothetical protein IGS40_06490 [Trichormus sp. M33_DOE_039]|nr:hypothetical protein [Trichormus sp. M33_DOE_039]
MSNNYGYYNTPQLDPLTKIKLDVLYESLRQAQQMFNLVLISSLISLSVSTVGALLILWGYRSEGTLTATTGVISSSLIIWINRLSIQRMEALRRDVERTKKSIVGKMDNK